jgi:hypothetical protein
MSHSCSTDIVPFVVHNIFWGESSALPDNDLVKIAFFEEWAEEQDEDPTEPTDIRGWVTSSEVVNFGRKGRFFVNWITKGEHKVFFINESQYSNVGEYEASLCADDKASIEAFMADFDDCIDKSENAGELVIEEKDAVQQWM